MSQSIPTGYIPPGQPQGKLFEPADPGHPSKFFLSNPLPSGQKMMVEFLGVGQNFSKLVETPLKLAKESFKKFRKLRKSTNFLFGELNKTFIF